MANEVTNPTIDSPVLSHIATVNSKLPELPVKDGQMIFVQDKNVIALDFDGKRRFYKQIEEISTEEARMSMLAPVTGHYYFVTETGVLWTYQDKWVQITMAPNDIKDYADSVSKNIDGVIDENGDVVITLSDKLFTIE